MQLSCPRLNTPGEHDDGKDVDESRSWFASRGAGYFASMTLLATTHSHNLGWGIGLVIVGLLHLVFRGFYSRRSAAIETARQETAPGPLRGRGMYVTGRHANMVWIVGSSVVFVVVGVILIATQI
jgi:hypothetical protein